MRNKSKMLLAACMTLIGCAQEEEWPMVIAAVVTPVNVSLKGDTHEVALGRVEDSGLVFLPVLQEMLDRKGDTVVTPTSNGLWLEFPAGVPSLFEPWINTRQRVAGDFVASIRYELNKYWERSNLRAGLWSDAAVVARANTGSANTLVLDSGEVSERAVVLGETGYNDGILELERQGGIYRAKVCTSDRTACTPLPDASPKTNSIASEIGFGLWHTSTTSGAQARFSNLEITLHDTLWISAAVGGRGSIASDSGGLDGTPINCTADAKGACQATFPASQTVTLTAVPGPGESLTGWGHAAAACGRALTCQITGAGIQRVSATFAKELSHIPGLQQWLAAKDLVVQGLTDGSPIDQWTDRSGKNNHAIQSMFANSPLDARPILRTAALAGGKPGVYFDGKSYFDVRSEPGIYENHPGFAATELTFFVVATYGPTADQYPVSRDIVSGTDIRLWSTGTGCYVGNTTKPPHDYGEGCRQDATIADDMPHLFAMRRAGSQLDFFRKDGTVLGSKTDFPADGYFGFRYVGGPSRGWMPDTVSGGPPRIDGSFTGSFAELLVYDRALSDAEVAEVIAYLRERNGL